MICAVDIRVGGSDPLVSDLLEICILPLNHSYKPHEEFPPFNVSMRPSFLVDLKVARLNKDRFREQFEQSLLDQIKGVELFEYWWNMIRIKEQKKIIVLTWDWPVVKPWLQNWLGDHNFEYNFHETYRDLVPLMNFLNDREDYYGNPVKFVIPTFENVAKRSGHTLIDRNSLVANCVAMSHMYRKFLADR
jgi:hypothetical protein